MGEDAGGDPPKSDAERRGAALKARMDAIGLEIQEVAESTGITREQVGQILLGRVPGSRSWGVIEKAIADAETESDVTATSGTRTTERTSDDRVVIRLKGLYGAEEVVVEIPKDASLELRADLEAYVERLLRGRSDEVK